MTTTPTPDDYIPSRQQAMETQADTPLHDLIQKAIQTAGHIMQAPSTKPSDRLQAAKLIIQATTRLKDIDEQQQDPIREMQEFLQAIDRQSNPNQ